METLRNLLIPLGLLQRFKQEKGHLFLNEFDGKYLRALMGQLSSLEEQVRNAILASLKLQATAAAFAGGASKLRNWMKAVRMTKKLRRRQRETQQLRQRGKHHLREGRRSINKPRGRRERTGMGLLTFGIGRFLVCG